MKEKLISDWKTVIEQVNSELAQLSSFSFSLISVDWEAVNDENIAKYASNCAGQLYTYAKQILDSETRKEENSDSQKTYFATYIFLKYNECVLYDLGNSDIEFLNSLCDLNRALDSRIMDESHASEKLFLSAAKLNFKVHDYAKALEYAIRSIKLEEQNGPDIESNIDLRFQKRCLLAFCYEYSFDPNDRQGLCGDKNGLIEAVQLMIGYRPEKLLGQNGSGVCVFKKIVDDSRSLAVEVTPNASDIIEKIYNKTSDKCLAHLILNSYSRFISEEIRGKYISTLVHILAHCFSEIHKWNVLGAMKLANESIYFSRMAEILMRSLWKKDDTFITCYSTVLLENEEYISAIDVMERERDKLETKWKDDASNELAQVDFYIWYFSIIAKRYADEIVDLDLDRRIKRSRDEFYQYTQTHSNDKEAKVYYELLSMKEMLMTLFNDLRKSGYVDPESCRELIEKWKTFSECRPQKSVHKVIREEWENLSRAFHIFISCYRYNNTGNDWYLFNMENLLFAPQSGEDAKVFKKKSDITNAKNQRHVGNIDDNKCHGCYEITWSQGNILYIGPPQRKIHNIFAELGIDYEARYLYDPPEAMKSGGEVWQTLGRISNILFIYNGRNINFLQELCNGLETIGYRVKTNIFLYDLSESGESSTDHTLTSILDSNIDALSIKKITNLRTAVQNCVLFSALEKCIYRVSRPLDALVISPIETAKTYSDQNFDEAFFLLRDDIGTLELHDGDVAAWQSNLNACFSHDDGKIKMKRIRPNFFNVVDTSNIEFILLFEPLARTELDKKHAVTKTAVYHFSDLKSNVIGHTFSNKCNERDHDRGDVVYSSIQKLYDNRHPSFGKLHKAKCMTWGNCCSVFYNDLISLGSSQPVDDGYYLKFARVVYLYLGINIGNAEGDYAIVRVSDDALTHVNKYIFCKFKPGTTIDTVKYCKELQTCIEDVARDHVSGCGDNACAVIKSAERTDTTIEIQNDSYDHEVKDTIKDTIDNMKKLKDEIDKKIPKWVARGYMEGVKGLKSLLKRINLLLETFKSDKYVAKSIIQESDSIIQGYNELVS